MCSSDLDKAQEKIDTEAARESAERLLSAQFTLDDFLTQMREMKKLGPLQDLLGMLPGVPGARHAIKDLAAQVDDAELGQAEAIILSMTREERRNPAIIGGSRRRRIAAGAGCTTTDVNGLLKDFEGARTMMRSMMSGKGAGIPGVPGAVLRRTGGSSPRKKRKK